MQFQATCSKGNKKLTLSLTALNLEDARNILHSQGYSIIEIKESLATPGIQEGNFFYFDARISGILQSGKIQSTDIFKAYKKLVEDLKYDVIYIYTNEGMPEEQKKIITAKVQDGYRLYKESIGEDMDKEFALKRKNVDDQELQSISPEILKEIEKYNKLVDSSIEKIQNLFLKYHTTITPDQKYQLEDLEKGLVQAKGTRNLGKIQTTVENALMTIGQTELALLKVGLTDEKKKFLQETNALLKQIGSKDRIETEEEKKDKLEYKLGNLFNAFSKPKEPVEKKEKKDTNSFIYFKNKRELDIYKKKLQSLELEIVQSIASFKFGDLKKLFLKRKLIKQNIQIIDNRINNRVISYTKIVHGLGYYIDNFFEIVKGFSSFLFLVVFFYTIFFIFTNIINQFLGTSLMFVGKNILFVTILSVITLISSYIRGFISLAILIPVGSFIVYFLSTNF